VRTYGTHKYSPYLTGNLVRHRSRGQPVNTFIETIAVYSEIHAVWSGNLPLVLASIVILGFGPLGTHDIILLSRPGVVSTLLHEEWCLLGCYAVWLL
jgi:hypothetical protein